MNIIKFLFQLSRELFGFLIDILADSVALSSDSVEEDLKRHRERQRGRNFVKLGSFDSVTHKISTGEL